MYIPVVRVSNTNAPTLAMLMASRSISMRYLSARRITINWAYATGRS